MSHTSGLVVVVVVVVAMLVVVVVVVMLVVVLVVVGGHSMKAAAILQAPSAHDAKLVACVLPSGQTRGEYSQEMPFGKHASPDTGSTTGQVTGGQAQQSSPIWRRGMPSLHTSCWHTAVEQLSGQAQQSSPIGRRGMPSLHMSCEQTALEHLLVHVLGASAIRGLAQAPTH